MLDEDVRQLDARETSCTKDACTYHALRLLSFPGSRPWKERRSRKSRNAVACRCQKAHRSAFATMGGEKDEREHSTRAGRGIGSGNGILREMT